jgi:hypothetical protein
MIENAPRAKGQANNYDLWVYDIECAFEEVPDLQTLEFVVPEDGFATNIEYRTVNAKKHVPCLVVARNVFYNHELVFEGKECLDNLITYMLRNNDGFNILVAHNASGYDSRFVFETAVRMGKYLDKNKDGKPNIHTIRRGTKMLKLVIQNMKFIDSLLFLPASLAALAKSFNLPLKKGYFPHLFNVLENHSYSGRIPDKKYYDLTYFYLILGSLRKLTRMFRISMLGTKVTKVFGIFKLNSRVIAKTMLKY